MRYLDVDGGRVSAIGLGSWQLGSRELGHGADETARVAPALVRRALAEAERFEAAQRL